MPGRGLLPAQLWILKLKCLLSFNFATRAQDYYRCFYSLYNITCRFVFSFFSTKHHLYSLGILRNETTGYLSLLQQVPLCTNVITGHTLPFMKLLISLALLIDESGPVRGEGPKLDRLASEVWCGSDLSLLSKLIQWHAPRWIKEQWVGGSKGTSSPFINHWGKQAIQWHLVGLMPGTPE